MITTKHATWDAKFRLWRQHGMSVTDAVRHQSTKVIFESYEEMGYNYRMTDIQAAVGRVQLAKIPEIVERRREQVGIYRELLSAFPEVTLPSEKKDVKSNWQSYCIRLPNSVPQKKFMQFCLDNGVPTRRGVMCTHREKAYGPGTWRSKTSTETSSNPDLIQSERAQDECVILPLHHELTQGQQILIAHTVAKGIEASKK